MGLQHPVVSNCATTGHKLQGKTVENIMVLSWNYKTNWPYVVLSRVKTMAGLWMLQALDTDICKYIVPKELRLSLHELGKKLPDYGITDDEIINAHLY